MLVHVIDCATLEPGRDPMTDLDVIERELALYVPDAALGGRPLAERTRIIVLNKADVPEALELAELVRPDLEARGLEVHIVSAVARTGLKELSFSLARHVRDARAVVEAIVQPRIVLRPKAIDDSGFSIRKERTPEGETAYRVVGERPTRWVRQTDFTNQSPWLLWISRTPSVIDVETNPGAATVKGGNVPVAQGQTHLYSVERVPKKLSYLYDHAVKDSTTFSSDYSLPLQMRFSAYNGSKIKVRWARIRMASDPPPTASLGPAEQHP